MSFADRSSSSSLPPFADKKFLVAEHVPFCISAVREVTQQHDGETRWFLDIHRFDGKDGEITETLTLGKGGRDAGMEELRSLIPDGGRYHNVHLEQKTVKKTGKSFYDLVPAKDDECMCAQPAKETAPF